MFFRFFTAICTLLAIGLAPDTHASAPMVQTQVPGYYRIQLGRFEITALNDGETHIDSKLLNHIGNDRLRAMLAAQFVDYPKMPTSVNAYLINTGDHLVLVDTGGGIRMKPALGKVAAALEASGYRPAQVDTILLTHMHGDHIGGLIDGDGKPLYPNATVMVAKAESDYWLSTSRAAKATAKMQARFDAARRVAAPYQARDRWHTFTKGTEVVPGILALDARGHTPGHTAYQVESEGHGLLIWGDLVHAHAVQFARPGVSIAYDSDQQQAIVTRRGLFKATAASGILVAGMHLPFPGIGHVRAVGNGSYAWVPIELAPLKMQQ